MGNCSSKVDDNSEIIHKDEEVERTSKPVTDKDKKLSDQTIDSLKNSTSAELTSDGKNPNKSDDDSESVSGESISSTRNFPQIKDFIKWSDIQVKTATAEEAILGTGSFGTVIRASWIFRRLDGSMIQEVEVAVKVLTRSSSNTSSDEEYYDIINRAVGEVVLLQNAERTIGSADRIVRAYGVAKGILPRDLTTLFNILDDDEGVGIVMRYEGGGSLENLLHSRRARQRPPLPVREKIYLLKGIAHALAELHSIGIVHADIKPENVLLSHHNPPQVRLADFGMSIYQEQTNSASLGASSLSTTTHMRGTPVYCAPEMLINPYAEFDGTVAKSSRKTDMYAFAMLAWEVLTQERPFSDLRSEGVLCSRVHKGYRPPIDKLPPETPFDVIGMIELCWDKDRSQRLSAVECLAILHYQHDLESGKKFDVFLSHSKAMRPFLSHVAHTLIQRGYRVWFDQTDEASGSESPLKASSRSGITQCKVFFACVDKSYVENMSCLNELRAARESRPVLVLILEASPETWVSSDFTRLCQLESSQHIDLSGSVGAREEWNREEGPNSQLLEHLDQGLVPAFKFLADNGCQEGGTKRKKSGRSHH
jgi:serine/threonine protein kinase